MKERIGFMQGRLSPLVKGRIQAFPTEHWEQEFPLAQRNGLCLMEWTLDQEDLHRNPLLTTAGRQRIQSLSTSFGVRVASLTGDCFMHAPLWKAGAGERESLERDFLAIIDACGQLDIGFVIVPLVDGGSLANRGEENDLVAFLEEHAGYLRERAVRVLFECDFAPTELARFIERLAPELFGINYDMGNSAALGFDAREEFGAYGRRVLNVHVKDRVLGGATVPLGTGNVDFPKVFDLLARIDYLGNYVLQTARANDGDHEGALRRYRDLVVNWTRSHGT